MNNDLDLFGHSGPLNGLEKVILETPLKPEGLLYIYPDCGVLASLGVCGSIEVFYKQV